MPSIAPLNIGESKGLHKVSESIRYSNQIEFHGLNFLLANKV